MHSGVFAKLQRWFARLPRRLARRAVGDLGVPPSWTGYRWLSSVPVERQVERARAAGAEAAHETIHPEERKRNPLPRNVTDPMELPAERGWWGYSFRDVPSRVSGPTFRATIPNARVLPYVDPGNDQFYACIVTADDQVLDLRELAFRDGHPRMLRKGKPRRVERATWILERVYHNHSHWLTAHLPKVLLARDLGLLPQTILPGSKATPAITDSLRMLGVGRADARWLDDIEPLEVGELTVLGTDRFRPELLRPVRQAFKGSADAIGSRRIYISRARAARRRLVNEDVIWPLLQARGFERVFMEDLAFEAQVRLMGEAEAVVAPHGAGLTNVIFAPEATAVVEIADLSFPNPNFYALSAAMGHRYWIVAAETRGTGHPLERDMWVDPARVEAALHQLSS